MSPFFAVFVCHHSLLFLCVCVCVCVCVSFCFVLEFSHSSSWIVHARWFFVFLFVCFFLPVKDMNVRIF